MRTRRKKVNNTELLKSLLRRINKEAFIFLVMSIILINCSKNNDKVQIYQANKVLSELNMILNESIPEYKEISSIGFSNRPNGKTIGYTVYDLSKKKNINKFNSDTISAIEFLDNHFYHFSPVIKYMSYSHIAFLEKGKIKVFKFINCPNKGDDLADVLKFAEQKLRYGDDKNEVLKNIENYRDYGYYHVEDNYGASVNCE
jgi:hypothetical protein